MRHAGTYCDVPDCGQSGDCNSNGVPDECEQYDDCNANSIQDVCDVASGTSLDCNGNGVPDECDISEGTSQDCQPNDAPDECELDPLVYFTDFESGAGPEWTSAAVDNSRADLFTQFSGRFSTGSQTLTLDVAPGVDYVLGFDLCVIDTWEGTGGSDFFTVLADGVELFRSTFHANGPAGGQSYPSWPAVGPGQYGWGSGRDSIYRGLEIRFTPTDDVAQLTFQAQGLEGVSDESWGIDNVAIALASGGDCNGNGVPDDCDLLGGMSLDINANGVSDNCERTYIADHLPTSAQTQPVSSIDATFHFPINESTFTSPPDVVITTPSGTIDPETLSSRPLADRTTESLFQSKPSAGSITCTSVRISRASREMKWTRTPTVRRERTQRRQLPHMTTQATYTTGSS